ncbi:MAG: hypothetical protein JWQ79_34 [Mucilaginibacter sp.]|nr:hypothetical protein [Mucilaginibacter sp.]
MRAITHPVFASLDHPLFTFGVKRVTIIKKTSLRLAEERVDKRSDVGVSQRVKDCSGYLPVANACAV